MEYYSQPWIGQDAFVAGIFNFKKDGFFVDIGCHHYKDISNTYFFEKNLNWRGLAVDMDSKYEQDWKTHRPNSLFVNHDGTTLNYQEVLDNLNAPKIIDYLTVDTEPPLISLICLLKILKTTYTFRVITFETDYYRGDLTAKEPSRIILQEKGYTLIKDVNGQDDFWINCNAMNET